MSHTTSRRTFSKAAAWSVPAVAVAVAAPQAAASTLSTANYYWADESQGRAVTLDAAAGGDRAQFSTQIAYRADPWVNPPNGTIVLTLTFTKPVTAANIAPAGWTQVEPTSGPATQFVFTYTPSGYGTNLTMEVTAATPGELTVTAGMTLTNGGSATCETRPATATATLVE